MSFSQKILLWYAENKRDLPWRSTRDPYLIWLSEIMLQQTRVAQGIPYYKKFATHFPTVDHLASASEEKVLKLWQGLGYYSRARNLHTTAKMVVDLYDGSFPETYDELLKLKGVGDYTASAISSICFNEPRAVVDGNVFRVLARYYGIDKAINSTEGVKYFRQLAYEIMDPENIRDYNQGLMEFGSLQCAPKNPDCGTCPLNGSCVALETKKVSILPVKINKTKIKHRYFNYLVPVARTLDNEKVTLFRQRTGKGIWQNLWEFPLVESEEEIHTNEIRKKIPEVLGIKKSKNIFSFNENEILHKLSHQHLHTKFWIVETDDELLEGVPFSTLENYPVPVLLADFIKGYKS